MGESANVVTVAAESPRRILPQRLKERDSVVNLVGFRAGLSPAAASNEECTRASLQAMSRLDPASFEALSDISSDAQCSWETPLQSNSRGSPSLVFLGALTGSGEVRKVVARCAAPRRNAAQASASPTGEGRWIG
jgi:hypothetical protein